jgi:hypothetical protein
MVTLAPVSMGAICYVCGYVKKKEGNTDTFSLCSKGIGKEWLRRFHNDITRTGTVTIEGREYPVPRRYFDWALDEFEHVKASRLEIAKQRQHLQTDYHLRSKAVNYKARSPGQGEKL